MLQNKTVELEPEVHPKPYRATSLVIILPMATSLKRNYPCTYAILHPTP